MATTYRQGDSRWASYSYAGDTMAGSGCGPTAVAILVNQSPVTIANWMTQHGYASNGSGTYWEGIPAALTAYGAGGKQLNYSSLLGRNSSSIFTTWKNTIKSGQMGILLMGAGSNTYWTRGGHYIAVTKYDANSDRYYVIDPGNGARDGWHSWNDFAYNIKILYTSTLTWNGASVSSNSSNITSSGAVYTFTPETVKMGSTGNSVYLLQEILYARGIYLGQCDKISGAQTVEAIKKFQKLKNITIDGIAGNTTWTYLLNKN